LSGFLLIPTAYSEPGAISNRNLKLDILPGLFWGGVLSFPG